MNEKILVVDDEQDILQMLSKLLLQEDYQVKTALGGEEAIAMFKSEPEPFDAVITDMRMPGVDGIGVIKAIKEIDEYIEVIILTGYAALDNVIQAFRDHGAFDYLT
ncbi:MAG TPA: response regulator, partial [Deltaproteobacteria bacterium]|nr:response regulator [Deltaproteobacteria bacterium]